MHDLVIRGGVVHDGLGSPGARADVAIHGGRVVAIGRDVGPGRREIDAEGRFVAPGFVDAHSHSDALPLMDEPQPFKLLQGVTTEIVGNCGFSIAPLDDASAAYVSEAWGDLAPGVEIVAGSFGAFLDRLEAAGPTNNVAPLVGHGTLRMTANGARRELSDGALERMCALAEESFEAGAVGLSTGLIYVPATYPRTWGCFPEFFGRYVRERGIVGWEEAIRKATSAAALQFDLAHRGTLQPGSIADICVFDPETIAHPGSYAEPSATPVGIDHVLLAGSVVVENGGFIGVRDGRVLRA